MELYVCVRLPLPVCVYFLFTWQEMLSESRNALQMWLNEADSVVVDESNKVEKMPIIMIIDPFYRPFFFGPFNRTPLCFY